MRSLVAVLLAATSLLAGCSEPAAPEAALPQAAPEPLLVSIPVSAELSMGPEGGCIVQGDQPPIVSTCEANPEIESYDLLANQTVLEAHLVLQTGGTVPQGAERVLRLSCEGADPACLQPLAEVSGDEPLALDWTGEVAGPVRLNVEPFLRGATAAVTWHPIVASAMVSGEFVARQAPTRDLPQELVRIVEAIDVTGQTAPCMQDTATICDYPAGSDAEFGPYEQPIEEVHLVAEWQANDPSNEELAFEVVCRESTGTEWCDGFDKWVIEGPSPLAFDKVVTFPPTGALEFWLVRYSEVPGVVGPVSQPFRVTGTVVHLGDPDAYPAAPATAPAPAA